MGSVFVSFSVGLQLLLTVEYRFVCVDGSKYLANAHPSAGTRPQSPGLPVGEEAEEQQSCGHHHQHPLRRVGPQR